MALKTEAGISPQLSDVERLAKALANPLRVKIMVELNKRVMSPSRYYRECGGGSLSRVSRHFRKLEEYGCVEMIETKRGGKRRGAVEHFYRATQRSLYDEVSWPGLPGSIKDEFTKEIFDTFAERVIQALVGGTMNSRDDRHFTWSGLAYDQQAWDNMRPRFDELFRLSLEQAAAAADRIADGAEAIPITAALALFESPAEPAQDV